MAIAMWQPKPDAGLALVRERLRELPGEVGGAPAHAIDEIYRMVFAGHANTKFGWKAVVERDDVGLQFGSGSVIEDSARDFVGP